MATKRPNPRVGKQWRVPFGWPRAAEDCEETLMRTSRRLDLVKIRAAIDAHPYLNLTRVAEEVLEVSRRNLHYMLSGSSDFRAQDLGLLADALGWESVEECYTRAEE